jgi:hypothetical protein
LVCQTHLATAQTRRIHLDPRTSDYHHRFIADANDELKPFVWTTSADAIPAALERQRQALEIRLRN